MKELLHEYGEIIAWDADAARHYFSPDENSLEIAPGCIRGMAVWLVPIKRDEDCGACGGKVFVCPECGGGGKAMAENDHHTYEVDCDTCEGGDLTGDTLMDETTPEDDLVEYFCEECAPRKILNAYGKVFPYELALRIAPNIVVSYIALRKWHEAFADESIILSTVPFDTKTVELPQPKYKGLDPAGGISRGMWFRSSEGKTGIIRPHLERQERFRRVVEMEVEAESVCVKNAHTEIKCGRGRRSEWVYQYSPPT